MLGANNPQNMNRMKQIMLATLGIAALAQSAESPYDTTRRKEGMRFNPDYKPRSASKELREFCVKGEKVMAYSKKDALKRLNYRTNNGLYQSRIS